MVVAVPKPMPLRPLGFVNKKIMESSGDLGVPRITKKAPTVAKEFNLSAREKSSTARKTVVVPDEMTRPVFSSFGNATPRATPRAIKVSKPVVPPAKPMNNVKAAPQQNAAAPKKTAMPAETVAPVETIKAAPIDADEWVMVADANRVPCGKRRVWAQERAAYGR